MSALCVITDEEDGRQALYVDGKLAMHDETIYACDIAHYAANKQIEFSHEVVTLPDGQSWPESFDEAIVFKYPIKND